jgi:hypothetical protein
MAISILLRTLGEIFLTDKQTNPSASFITDFNPLSHIFLFLYLFTLSLASSSLTPSLPKSNCSLDRNY